VATARNEYFQAGTSFETFAVLICFSGEYRVPARSCVYIGQSFGLSFAFWA
jgi:hypothetical protein